MSGTKIVEAVDPAEAFAALSNETRVDILRALWETDGEEATFSELREAVGMRDSGQFNYHLDTLTDRFVVRSDDGYRLTLAGEHVVGSLLAGAYTMEGTVDPIPLDEPCPFCGGAQTFRYEDETVVIDCDDCKVKSHSPVPPGVFSGYDVEAFPTVAERYLRTILRKADDGFCPICEGRMEPTVLAEMPTDDPEREPPERFRDFPMVRYACDRCGQQLTTQLGAALLDHPAVVAFHHENGVDVRDESFFRFVATDRESVDIRQRDPLRASVTYTADGDDLTLVVDGDLDVRKTTRSEADTGE
jgi:hypothetical protein